MRTPQRRAHLAILRKAIQNKNRQLKRLRAKVASLLERNSESTISLDEKLSKDIQMVIDNHKEIEKDDFKRIFWEQQVVHA